MRTDDNAWDCTLGCTDTRKSMHCKLTPGAKKIPCCTGESNLPQRRVGPTLYQLSYIPAPSILCSRFFSSWTWLCLLLTVVFLIRTVLCPNITYTFYWDFFFYVNYFRAENELTWALVFIFTLTEEEMRILSHVYTLKCFRYFCWFG